MDGKLLAEILRYLEIYKNIAPPDAIPTEEEMDALRAEYAAKKRKHISA